MRWVLSPSLTIKGGNETQCKGLYSVFAHWGFVHMSLEF